MIQIASATLGVALILFSFSRVLWLSLILMVFVGFGLIQTASVSNTIIQSLVPEDKRARVMGYYTMAFVGTVPFGSLLAGALAHRIGAPHTALVTGVSCCISSVPVFVHVRTAKIPSRHASDLSANGFAPVKSRQNRNLLLTSPSSPHEPPKPCRRRRPSSPERNSTVNWHNSRTFLASSQVCFSQTPFLTSSTALPAIYFPDTVRPPSLGKVCRRQP